MYTYQSKKIQLKTKFQSFPIHLVYYYPDLRKMYYYLTTF